MRVCVLGSSSGGNAVFMSDGRTRILIDTGNLPVLSYLRPALEAVGEDWRRLDAILISHAHGDHLNGNTFSVAYRTRTPVYLAGSLLGGLRRRAARGGWRYLAGCISAGLVRPLDGEGTFGGLEVRTFPLPHDCDPTLGFVVVGRDGRRVGVATDLGHCPGHVVEHLRDCDVLVFEANHDVEMERRSGREEMLIERVLGRLGHLSNEQSAEALCEIIGTSRRRRPACVFLAHISRQCNLPDLACATVRSALERFGLAGTAVEPTFARRPSRVIESGRGA